MNRRIVIPVLCFLASSFADEPKAKADPECCYHDWENMDQCYYWHYRNRWDDDWCNSGSLGNHLTSVLNAFQNADVRDHAIALKRSLKSPPEPIWMGGTYDTVGEKWQWADGQTFSYANWMPGYPTDESRNRCLAMEPYTGNWLNAACDQYYYGLCKGSKEC